MGIFGALITSVSGLNAQAYALENISGNIANSQTTAYKRTDTSFSDLVSGASARQQVSGSTQAFSRATNNLQGDPQNATVDTYMAINGEGFFSVQKPSSTSDGRPVFDGVDLFTRRGDFQLDSNGYLVNGAGYYLRALRIDPVTGNPVGSLPTVVQFQNDFLPAQPTTRIEYRANLATYPLTQSAKADVARSELIDPSYFWANPIATSSPAQVSGHSAALLPDATAKLTGSVDLTAAPAFTAPAGSTLRLNGTAINFTGGETATQVRDAINTAMTGASIPITASIDSTGHLVLTGGNADTAINIDGTSTLSLLNGLGINSGTTNPTNLLTQSAVGQGETLTIGVGGNQQTITFGTGAGEVSTLAELQAAVASAANTLDLNYQVDASGNVSFTARNITDTIAIDGTATLSSFGLSKGTAMPSNGTVRGIDESTFLAQSISGGAVTAYDVNGSPVNLQFRWAKSDSATYGGTTPGTCSTSPTPMPAPPIRPGRGCRRPTRSRRTASSPRHSPRSWSPTSPSMAFRSATSRLITAPAASRSLRHQRHGFGQPSQSGWLRGGRSGQYRGVVERAHRRQLFEWPLGGDRADPAVLVQRAQHAAEARRRRVFADGRFRHCDRRRHRHGHRPLAGRFQHRYRRRVHQADRHAAGLCRKHARGHHRERDDAGNHADVALT